jgi:hypothetical protein
VRSLDKKLIELNQDIFRHHFYDSLVMARMREVIDTVSNINKEDKMVISGLSSKTPKPTAREETSKWLKEIVSHVLDFFEPGISAEIIFVSQGRSANREIPVADVRMSSKEIAVRLRNINAQKKKTGRDFGRVYISNCVTHTTRVRIEIQKTMSKKFVMDKEDFYVIGYASRPVLHVKTKIRIKNQCGFPFQMLL